MIVPVEALGDNRVFTRVHDGSEQQGCENSSGKPSNCAERSTVMYGHQDSIVQPERGSAAPQQARAYGT